MKIQRVWALVLAIIFTILGLIQFIARFQYILSEGPTYFFVCTFVTVAIPGFFYRLALKEKKSKN